MGFMKRRKRQDHHAGMCADHAHHCANEDAANSLKREAKKKGLVHVDEHTRKPAKKKKSAG